MPPKVSIIMPAYNAEKDIEKAIESVLNQSFNNFELIIVDDGSTDNTSKIVSKYADKVNYIYQENSGTPGAARNTGIAQATGEYVAFFDSDDIMLPTHLESSLNLLGRHQSVSLIFSNFVPFMDETGRFSDDWFSKPRNKSELERTPHFKENESIIFKGSLFEALVRNNFIVTSSVIVRKACIDRVGLFNPDMMGGEDRDMWLRLCEAGFLFAAVTKPMLRYRIRGTSTSRNPKSLLSYINWWEELLSKNKNPNLIPIIKHHLAEKSFGYGYYCSRIGSWSKAFSYYLKSFRYGNWKDRIRAIGSIGKLPLKMLKPTINSPETTS